MKTNLVLIGLPGAGKTQVGRAVAARLGRLFLDTDEMVEADAGMQIAELFAAKGEQVFRDLERRAVARAIAQEGAVIACGGGAPVSSDVAEMLRDSGYVVHLDVTPSVAAARLGSDGSGRPLLAGNPDGGLSELAFQRSSIYKSVADLSVGADASVGEVVDEVVAHLRSLDALAPDTGAGALSGPGESAVAAGGTAADRTRRVEVHLGPRSYPVFVGAGLLVRLESLLPPFLHAEKAFVVSHLQVMELFGRHVVAACRQLGWQVHEIQVPATELSKSLEMFSSMHEQLSNAGAHRHDCVITLGGGVVGDLGGLVAATHLRGMPLVHIPTTLVAQVDAAIGGKTAVNLKGGKNLVGVFYQPKVVVADLSTLLTLDERQFKAGLAEVIKYAFTLEPKLLHIVETRREHIVSRNLDVLEELVALSVAAKARVVSQDELDVTDERAVLNFGHTLAHALEVDGAYVGLTHGEAVSLGMMFAMYVAQEMGVGSESDTEKLKAVLQSYGLPVSIGITPGVRRAWSKDKKYRAGMRLVLLKSPGKATVESVPEEVLEQAALRISS